MSPTSARLPLVSVVIPTHDRLALLREALASVRGAGPGGGDEPEQDA